MPRNLVVLSDGTGNSASKLVRTNVWRLFQALDLTDARQIACYDDGVGSSSNRYLAALGGAFGWGLKRNVLDLYQFLCRHWQEGDAIYGFGFSRGAFTIRVLVDLVADQGLVDAISEDELRRNARQAYRRYRMARFARGSAMVRALRALRDGVLAVKDRLQGHRPWDEVVAATRARGRDQVRIRFLGLWDTVDAYGVPIMALKEGLNRWVWPMVFGDMKLSAKVDRACHALALDDERTTFHPLLWDEEEEARLAADPRQPIRAGRVTQVWFAGVHANVGGGYPEDQLSLVPLDWIMTEAAAQGLRLQPGAVQAVRQAASPYAKLYDSRRGLAAYYRYGPRVLPEPRDPQGQPILPIVHHSVLLRMAGGTDRYAPIVLPPRFHVLAPSGALWRMDGEAGPPGQVDPAAGFAAGDPSDPDAGARQAIASLSRIPKETVDEIRDTVFLRRCAYFATLGSTLLLAAFPWVAGLLEGLYAWQQGIGPGALHPTSAQSVERLNQSASGLIEPVVQALGSLLPSYAGPWITALRSHPSEVALLIVLVGLSLVFGVVQARHIRVRAWDGWHPDQRRVLDQQKHKRQRWRRGVLAGVVGLAGLLLLLQTLIGWPDGKWWRDLCGLVFVGGLSYLLLRSSGEPGRGLGLRLARWVRGQARLQRLYRAWTRQVVPGLTLVAMLAAGLLVLNRWAFDAAAAAGQVCTGSPPAQVQRVALGSPGVPGLRSREIGTRELCAATGIGLEAGRWYRLELHIPEAAPGADPPDWFDLHLRADLAGLVDPPAGLQALSLLKRHWGAAWFQPVARVGARGRDEHVLPLSGDVRPVPYPAAGHAPRPDDVLQPIAAGQAHAAVTRAATPPGQRRLTVHIRPHQSGELFLYVNDAVVAWPGLGDLFYGNNRGRMQVQVRALPEGIARLE